MNIFIVYGSLTYESSLNDGRGPLRQWGLHLKGHLHGNIPFGVFSTCGDAFIIIGLAIYGSCFPQSISRFCDALGTSVQREYPLGPFHQRHLILGFPLHKEGRACGSDRCRPVRMYGYKSIRSGI